MRPVSPLCRLVTLSLCTFLLLPGCQPKERLKKQFICEIPAYFLTGKNDYGSIGLNLNHRGFLLAGTRYAYILPVNDTLSILKTNDWEIKGNFSGWDHQSISCGTGIDYKALFKSRYERVKYNGSLSTFTITDKQYKRHTYMDGHPADTNLYKSYISLLHEGVPTIDTSIYLLKKTAYTEAVYQGRPYLRPQKTVNFYHKGRKGPDFREIYRVEVDFSARNHRYIGGIYSSQGEIHIPVINEKVYWKYPLTREGSIRDTRFGDVYFPFQDTLTHKEGYWINGKTSTRFDEVRDIYFSGKNHYEFVGINYKGNRDDEGNKTFYLVTNGRISKPYTYIRFTDPAFFYDYTQSFFHSGNKVMLTQDSLFCYQNARLIHQNKLPYPETVSIEGFNWLEKSNKTIIRGSRSGRGDRFFCINNNCLTEQIAVQSDEKPVYYSTKELRKYLGVSSNRTKYAWIEYEYPNRRSLRPEKALLYVNDSLVGKFSPELEFFWDNDDHFLLKGEFATLRDALQHQNAWDSTQYRQYVAQYYPQGIPPVAYSVLPSGSNIRTGTVEDKIPYIFINDHFDIRDTKYFTWEYDMQMGLTGNDHFYYLEKERSYYNWLHVDFKAVYGARKIFELTDEQNYIRFYSLEEGNKLYLVTYDLNE